MKITEANVKDLKEAAAKKLLRRLIAKLDDLDGEDFFGTEGWRKMLLGED